MNREIFVTTPKEGFSYDGAVKPRVDFGNFANNKVNARLVPIDMYTGKDNLGDNSRAVEGIPEGSLVFYQTPTYTTLKNELDFIKKAQSKDIIVIGLVHDVDFLRFGGSPQDTLTNLKEFDCLVLPSESLYEELKRNGCVFTSYELQEGPWDYSVANGVTSINHKSKAELSLAVNYAGNLVEGKAGFIDELLDLGIEIKVFGQVEPWMSRLPSTIVQGPKNAEEGLISAMNSGFGLVWSGGPSDEVGYSSYELYNWPYKLSAYIAAGIVPIAKKGTNIGDWIDKHSLGVTIDKLSDIPNALTKMTLVKYNNYLDNAKLPRSKVISGGYTAKTIMNIYDWVRLYYGGN